MEGPKRCSWARNFLRRTLRWQNLHMAAQGTMPGTVCVRQAENFASALPQYTVMLQPRPLKILSNVPLNA